MEDGKFKNGFLGGLDRDTAPENYQNNKIFDAYNMRFSLDEGEGYLGRAINEKGNSIFSEINEFSMVSVGKENVQPADSQIRINIRIDGVPIVVSSPNTTDDYDLTTYEGSHQLIEDAIATDNTITYGHDQTVGFFWAEVDNKDIQFINIEFFENPGGPLTVWAKVFLLAYVNNHVIIGANDIRDSVVVFTTNENNTEAEPEFTDGVIWEFEFDPVSKSLIKKWVRFYSATVNFSTYNPIKSITLHENDVNRKVYWIDGYNNMRYFNLDRSAIFTQPSNLSLAPFVNFGSIELISRGTSGSFIAGIVQYGYQLYNKFGNQTTLSPLSDLYSVKTSSNLGGEVNEVLSTSFKIRVNGIDQSFTSIKLFRFHFTQPGVSPSVTLIDDFQFGPGNLNGSTTYSFLDTGDIDLGQVSIEEALLLGSENIKPEDIAAKHNILFAGGIEQDEFELDYDARAYSFKKLSSQLVLVDSQTNSELIENIGIKDDFDKVPVQHDAINPEYWDSNIGVEDKGRYKYWHNDFEDNGNPVKANYRFFRLNSSRLGGSGKNVSYDFLTAQEAGVDLAMNRGTYAFYPGTDDVQARSIGSVSGGAANGEKNYNNPYYLDYRGYQRGEIYRFGVVFIREDGQRSSAKWIADVKIPEHYFQNDEFTPSNNEATNMYYFDGQTYETKANPYYVRFYVNITQEMIDEGVVGYKIVRVERDDSEKTIVTQGYVTPCANIDYKKVNNTKPYYSPVLRAINSYFTHPDPSNAGQNDWRLIGEDQFKLTYYGVFPGGPFTNRAPYEHNYSNYNPYVLMTEDQNPSIIPPANLDFSLYKLYCPDAVYNKEFVHDESMWLDVIGSTRRAQMSSMPNTSTVYQNKFLEFRKAYPTPDIKLQTMNIVEAKIARSPLNEAEGISTATNIGLSKYVLNFCPDLYDSITGNNANKPPADGAFGGTCIDIRLDDQWTNDPRDSWPLFYNDWAWDKNGKADQSGGSAGTDIRLGEGRYESGPMMCNIKRVLSDQYGGLSFTSRNRTKYIDASDIVPVSTPSVYDDIIRRGDTFVTFFRNLRMMRGAGYRYYDPNDDTPGYHNGEFNAIPLETTINVDARANEEPFGELNVAYLRETEDQTTANLIAINNEPNGGRAVGVPTEDQYNLLKTYNQGQSLVITQELPINAETIDNRDVETRYSDVKNYNELIDSWTIFRPNNVNVVDARFGKIKALQFFNNQLLFFQEAGFGIWQVNQQALITAADGAQVELGTGTVLQRFDYMSKINGLESKFAVAAGDIQLLFYDQRRNKIIQAVKGSKEVSVIKGMNSYVEGLYQDPTAENELQNPLSEQGTLFYYDHDEKEFYMTFKLNTGTNDPGGPAPQFIRSFKDTITFMEKFDAFGPRMPYTPGVYVNCMGNMITTAPDFKSLYTHRKLNDNRGEFYGESAEECTITFLLNPAPGQGAVFIFDSLAFLLDVKQWNTTFYQQIHNEGLTAVTFQNDYQSEFIDLTTADEYVVRQKLRKWRIGIPRNVNTLERMRDIYLKVTLHYDNDPSGNTSRRIALSDIFYNARISRL